MNFIRCQKKCSSENLFKFSFFFLGGGEWEGMPVKKNCAPGHFSWVFYCKTVPPSLYVLYALLELAELLEDH